jgi:hypothetical protein
MAVEFVNLGPARWRPRLLRSLAGASGGLLAAIALSTLPMAPAVALAAGSSACNDPTSTGALVTDGTRVRPPVTLTLAALAQYRAEHDTDPDQRVPDDTNPSAVQTQIASRGGAAAARVTSSSLPMGCGAALHPFVAGAPTGAVWIDGLAQQGQANWYFCGPATLAEVASTIGHPVSQGTAAAWMGTNPQDGTTVAAMTNGLNHFVGQIVAHRDYYEFAWLDYAPTADQRSAFVQRLEYDVQHGWPLAGDAWEVPGGPHLVGHPPNQELFHWFEIGGYGPNGASVYYADSATTLWSGVQPYSWYDTQTLVTILGGRGYAW